MLPLLFCAAWGLAPLTQRSVLLVLPAHNRVSSLSGIVSAPPSLRLPPSCFIPPSLRSGGQQLGATLRLGAAFGFGLKSLTLSAQAAACSTKPPPITKKATLTHLRAQL